MVTTTLDYSNSRYRTFPGDAYDGVVRVSFGGYYGSGTLLFDGLAVLTAAHLFHGRTGTTTVSFATSAGTQTVAASQVIMHPGYDTQSNNDLALVWLDRSAPVSANRYEIYRGVDEIGETFSLVGYGRTGTGATGTMGGDAGGTQLLHAANRFDADAATLKNYMGSAMAWSPLAGTQLVADFDNGRAVNDALGQLTGRVDGGLGLDEGLIAPGDSGGPAFVDGRIAGVASYTASLSRASVHPDIDSSANSSYGEIAAWQRVSAFQQWIDQGLRAHYVDAPAQPAEVRKVVQEGHDGTGHVFFLLQFTGARADPEQVLSVDFATRDGSAVAGSDYVALSGTIRLYPDENQAVIPVEIIGDVLPEPDESFFLDVFNPVGGSFGDGLISLTAVRTIVDDDGWLG